LKNDLCVVPEEQT